MRTITRGRCARAPDGNTGKPLEIWLHYLALVPAVDPYLAAAVSFARSALGGAGVVMVHYTRVQGLTDLPTEASEVARAARDVGIRAGFAVAMRDRNPLVYGPSEPILGALSAAARDEIAKRFIRAPLPVADQIALVDAVAAAAGSDELQRPVRPAGGAVVLARPARRHRRGLGAHRAARAHAPARDPLPARLGRRRPIRPASCVISTRSACSRRGSPWPIASGRGRTNWRCWRSAAW